MGFRGRKYLNRVLGSDSDDLKAQSPLTHAAEIQAKVMLIHGDEDLRVPSYHAKKMRAALKKANNPAEWLYLADAGHGAFSVKNRTKVYEGLLKFLDENIGE
jgi:dipeptidyl aminopeptidase/acylaminoacyl peptidase